jgi:hypothetical protein
MQLTRKITPLWAQKLALFLPTGWAMDALHKLVNFGAPPTAVIPHPCVTAAAALGAGYVLSRSFRFHREDDSYLAAQFHGLVGHTGKKKAIIAVAHSILVIAYHVLKEQKPYHGLP